MIRQKSAYPLQPPRERGTLRAFALAALMHVLLGFFLYHGIQWQNSTPAGAEAELWTAVPDLSTPRAPPPPVPVAPAPPVPDEQADIALQEKKRKQEEAARAAQLAEQQRQQQLQAQQEAEAKRQQQLAEQQAEMAAALKKQQQQLQAQKLKQQQLAEQQKQDQLKKQQEQQKEQQKEQQQAQADAQKKAEADKAAKAKAAAQAEAAKKLDQERRQRLAALQGLAGGESSSGNGLAKSGTGSGAGGTATSAGYAEKVQRRVRPNIVWAGDTQGLETVVSVRCAPTGTLLSATITRGSGNSQWDDAALRAVQRSDPMPQDTNGKTPASFTITLRPAG